MRIRDAMLSTVPQVSAGASVDKVFDQLALAGEPSLIVMDHKQVVGVVSDSDLRRTRETDRRRLHAREVMQPVDPLSPDAPISDAANILLSRHLDRVPVAENGHLAGVITVGTLLELIGRGELDGQPATTK